MKEVDRQLNSIHQFPVLQPALKVRVTSDTLPTANSDGAQALRLLNHIPGTSISSLMSMATTTTATATATATPMLTTINIHMPHLPRQTPLPAMGAHQAGRDVSSLHPVFFTGRLHRSPFASNPAGVMANPVAHGYMYHASQRGADGAAVARL
ncbi:hypothetical protein MGN70_014252 [Eutypa lata]|nr:hypothetical protein MGN70_014252 [Eutypa lata]